MPRTQLHLTLYLVLALPIQEGMQSRQKCKTPRASEGTEATAGLLVAVGGLDPPTSRL